MKVAKFGGSSLADAEHIKRVVDIVLSDSDRRIIVVSAPGKRFKDDVKVTDMLINLAEKYIETGNADDELKAVVDRFSSIAKDLKIDNVIIYDIETDLIKRLSSKGDNNDKFIDLMKAAGEDNCAKLVAAYLKQIGVDAEYINPKDAGMILSDDCGKARVLPETFERLKSLRENDNIMIFPGFFGYSVNGDVVTFSRGGSDVTGSVIAAAIKADVYENFTDVDFVFAADPNIVDNPVPIPIFTYAEMRELSYAGFSVLHEETLEPVYRHGIPVNIRNTNNPDSPGTLIVNERNDDDCRPVVGIAADKGFFTIHVYKYMMNREVGFGRRLLEILEKEGVSYEHTPSGIDSISIVLKEKNCNQVQLERIINNIYNELKVDDVAVQKDIAIVMIVGIGMMRRVGVASTATTALAEAGVNISMINQGSSEVSIMFGIDAHDAVKAVRALYDAFFYTGC